MVLRLLLTLLVCSPFALPQGGGLPAKESFTYNIEWRLFNAGKAKVDLSSTAQPRPSYQIKLKLESTGFVSKLFKVDDDYTATMNANLCAESAQLIALEGNRMRDT